MAFVDFAPTTRPAQPAGRIVHALVRWIAARRAARAKTVAFEELWFAPEHRLRDLGIRRDELIQAMEIHRK